MRELHILLTGTVKAWPAFYNRMAMKLLSASLALVVAVTLVLRSGPGKAYACSCMALNSDESISLMLDASGTDAIVVGTVAERRAGDPETVVFDVDRQYHGENSRQFIVRYTFGENGPCPGYTVTEGTRHLLWLQHREPQPERSGWEVRQYGPPDPGDPPGVYTPMGCATSALASTEYAQEQIAIMERITTPWPPEPGPAWMPWAFAAGVLAAMALVVGAIARFNKRRAT